MEINANELAELRIEMVASEDGGVTNADQDKIESLFGQYIGILAASRLRSVSTAA